MDLAATLMTTPKRAGAPSKTISTGPAVHFLFILYQLLFYDRRQLSYAGENFSGHDEGRDDNSVVGLRLG